MKSSFKIENSLIIYSTAFDTQNLSCEKLLFGKYKNMNIFYEHIKCFL